MKKVLVFGMTENPGGIESVIMNYYRYINRNLIQLDFLCNCSKIAYEEEIEGLGGKIYKITPRKKNYFAFKKELDEFMKQNAHEYSAIWINVCSLVNIDYLILAKKYGIPKRIIHCHNSSNDGGIIKLIIHTVNKYRVKHYATDFWSCSAVASPWFFGKKIIKSSHYKIITNAIDINKFKRSQRVRDEYRKQLGLEDKIVIGHVGRFHFQKNHQFLIEIFEELIKRSKDYRLILIGQGELQQEIKELVSEKKLADKVMFLDAVSDVQNLYQVMDCFVLPSLFEGLGIVALEAQAAQLPCVLADTIPIEVKVNDEVIFVPLERGAKEWANVIERVKGRFDLSCKLAESKFDITKQVNDFERMFI